MAERMQHSEHTPKRRWRGWGRRMGVVLTLGLAVLAIACFAGGWRARSVERRLGAIFAAHAVTPEENAAAIYVRLLAVDPLSGLTTPVPGLPGDYSIASLTPLSQEERSRMLVEASRRPRCYFPALCDRTQPVRAMNWTLDEVNKRISAIQNLAMSILGAACDDLEQGRLEAAREELHCMAQMANHLRQQPALLDFVNAGVIEDHLLSTLAIFIVERGATNEPLSMIEAALPSLADAWETESADMRRVETLLDKRSVWDRLRSFVGAWSPQKEIELCARNYHRRICERRAVRTLIELRRYKNRWGRWPETLNEIRAQLPAVALSDPLGPGELVYEPERDGFLLYSTGRDARKDVGDGDNYPLWPRHGLRESLQKRQRDVSQTTGGQNTHDSSEAQ